MNSFLNRGSGRGVFGWFFGFLLVLVMGLSSTASAATWTVTSYGDDNGNAACTANACPTLRDAIAAAAAGDTINLTNLSGAITLTTGTELAIGKSLTITGPTAAGTLTVRAAATEAAATSRVFEIIGGTVSFSGISVTNGDGNGGSQSEFGGGIYVDSAADLTMSNCSVTGNVTGYGGGIYNLGTLTLTTCTISDNPSGDVGGGIENDTGATMTITTCTVSGNSAYYTGGGINNDGTAAVNNCSIAGNTTNVGGDGIGGGINNDGTGTMTVDGGTVNDNSSGSNGGAFYNSGTLTIINGTLTGNSGLHGAAIKNNDGTLTVIDSTISNNSIVSGGSGGGIYTLSGGTVTITGTTISNNVGTGVNSSGGSNVTITGCNILNNSAVYAGGGIFNDGGTISVASSTISGNTTDAGAYIGGGGIFNSYQMTLTDTTINGNSVTDITTGGGAGILNFSGVAPGGNTEVGSLTITDCTITGNTNSGGMGGGILNFAKASASGVVTPGSVTAINCTIAGNSSVGGIGGGILNNTATNSDNVAVTGTVSLLNTIVAGNTAATDNDVSGQFDQTGTVGNNLVGDLNSDATGFSTANHDKFGSDTTPIPISSILQTSSGAPVLASNGGPTQTIALIAGSPAIDTGNDTVTSAPDSLTTDQRGTGYPRKSGAHVDIGAYEYQQTAAPTISSIANQTAYLPGSTGVLSFTIGDSATSAANLTVTGASSNTTVVPATGIVLQGTGASRTVTVTPAAVGSSTITLTVADGSLTASTSFTVTVPSLATVSITPTPGTTSSSAPVTFTSTYYDSSGVSDFKNLRLIVNSSATGASGMYLIYNRVSNVFYMMKDDGVTLQGGGGYTPGSNNVLENSQGILNLAATTVTTSGNLVTVKWNLTPFGEFAGAHNLYMECDNSTGTTAGFNLMGTWTETLTSSDNLPEVQTLSPTAAASQSSTAVSLTSTVADVNSVNNISQSRILINSSLNAATALYGLYDNVGNKLYLFNDAGTAVTGGITPGTNAIIENSQGILNCAATTVTRTATQLTVNWSFTPNGFFSGTKQTYALVKDISGLTDGWRTMGTWAITKNSTDDSPLALSVTPLSTTSTEGTAETLTATYESPDGYANLNTCRVLINGALNAPSSLYAEYNRGSNLLYLFNNAGSAITGGFAPGSANTITNSQGSLNCAATHVTASGNSLVIAWNFTPSAAFTGAKNAYLLVSDNEGLSDGWRGLATWQINAATGALDGGADSGALPASKGPSSHSD